MTRRVAALFSKVSLIAACCTLAACTGATNTAAIKASAPGAIGTWGHAALVPGLPGPRPQRFSAIVSAVSCTAAGDCSAGGYYGYNERLSAFVVDETGGSWGKARVVAGTASYWETAVGTLSCASPGNCSAGGGVATHTGLPVPAHSPPFTSQAYVVNEKGGVWGKAEIVPGTRALNVGDNANVSSMSCAGVGDCTAGGSYESSPRGAEQHAGAFVVAETNGVWGTAHSVPRVSGLANANSTVSSVSCASPGNCAIGGQDYTLVDNGEVLGQAFVMDEKGGIWGSATEVPGTARLNVGGDASVASVSCTAVGDCTAGGYYAVGNPGADPPDLQAFVVDETGGNWGTAHEVPGTAALNAGADAQVTSVSCASPGNCAAGGAYARRSTSLAQQAFVVNEAHGTWGKAEEVPGTAPGAAKYDSQVSSVSCTSAGNCSAGGYDDGTEPFGSEQTGRAFVIDETGGTWGTAREVSGLAAIDTSGYQTTVASLSCTSAADCVAGGSYGYIGVNQWGYTDAFVVDKSN